MAAAQGKSEGQDATPDAIAQAAKGVAGTMLDGIGSTARVPVESIEGWRERILWVDDSPENNEYERGAFEAMGITFSIARSTQEGLSLMVTERFAAIISDMGRREGPEEGYVLLKAVRESDPEIPFFIYAGSNAPEHKRKAKELGAQGSTNRPQELLDLVVRSLGKGE